MNYDHSFHAGSFTDVYKHMVLMCLFEKLKLKDKAFCYLDTHSAFPYSDVNSVNAQRTQEAQQGIKKLWQSEKHSALVKEYLKLIDRFNTKLGAKRRYYPGSSAFAAMLKRPQDCLILNELASEPYVELKKFFKSDASIHCHQQDGYQILKALLPPKEKRGLILIDPPYENPQELNSLLQYLVATLTLWPQGIYAIWYPIKEMRRIEVFASRLEKLIDRPQANFICCPLPNDVGQRLSGSGMLLINPPWQIEQRINPIIDELCTIFR